MKVLTWNDLANLYDQHHGGRKARTLRMETVSDWAENRPDLFVITEDGSFALKEKDNAGASSSGGS
jgi:hypothetical protein